MSVGRTGGPSGFGSLGPKAARNLAKAAEIAEKTDKLAKNSGDFSALCSQLAAQQAQKAGVTHTPPAPAKKAAKKAPPLPPRKKTPPPLPPQPSTTSEIRPLTAERVSTKPPESKGFFNGIFKALSRAFAWLRHFF